MEARKITIVSTKTQKKNVIMSEAETLGQLKEDLFNAGIDYDDMTFYEGVSKTELKHDDSVLPTNVPYTNRRTGETINTNELVFMLTNQNKKIKSGMDFFSMNRPCLFDYIRKNSLQERIAEAFGKNFTQCSSADLREFLNSLHQETAAPVCQEDPDEECEDYTARWAILAIVEELYNVFEVDSDVLDHIKKVIHDETPCDTTVRKHNSPYSDEEIDDMIADSLS